MLCMIQSVLSRDKICVSATLSHLCCHISNYVQEMQSTFSLRSLWVFMNTLELQPGRDLEGCIP